MEFKEKELEDWLYEEPDALGLDGLGWIGRQVTVESGIIDLIGIIEADCPYIKDTVVIVELKAVPLTGDAILQVCRYAIDVRMVFGGLCHIKKIVISVGDIPDKLQMSADECQVELRSVRPHFTISGCWDWRHEFIEKRRKTAHLVFKQAYEDMLIRRQMQACYRYILSEKESVRNDKSTTKR